MKNTYFITDGQIEVDIGDDYLSITDYSKAGLSKSLVTMQKKVMVSLAWSLLCFMAAFAIAYFSLYKVTIYCEKSGKDVGVSCSVNKNYYIKKDIEILSLQPVKQARVDHSFGETSTCRIEITTANDELILPFGMVYSSGLCKTNFETQILPLFDYKEQTAKQTVTLSKNLFPWVGIVILVCWGFYLGLSKPSNKYLVSAVFDRKQRKITMTHANVYRSYQKEYHFNDIRKVVFTGDPKRPAKVKSVSPDIDFYLLLIDLKKAYLYFNTNTTKQEKYEIANLIRQILAS